MRPCGRGAPEHCAEWIISGYSAHYGQERNLIPGLPPSRATGEALVHSIDKVHALQTLPYRSTKTKKNLYKTGPTTHKRLHSAVSLTLNFSISAGTGSQQQPAAWEPAPTVTHLFSKGIVNKQKTTTGKRDVVTL